MKSRSVVMLCVLGGVLIAAGVPLAILGITHALTARKDSGTVKNKENPEGVGPRAGGPRRGFRVEEPRFDPVPPPFIVDVAPEERVGPFLGFEPVAFAEKPVAAEEVKALHGAPVRADHKVSSPIVHGNLSVFLIHGARGDAPAVLTLQEGLDRGMVTVHAAPITIDNRGGQPLFLQAGDLIKGGTQDRVIPYDQLIPAHASRVPVTVFCVESGRSFPRGVESSVSFTTSNERLPTKALRLAAYRRSQAEVWTNVSKLQEALTRNLGGSVRSPLSATSLQLTLEHPLVWESSQKYVDTLTRAVAGKDDVVGLVVAVNGKVVSGDVYASPELFRSFQAQLLRAAAVEALAAPREEAAGGTVTVEGVETFLAGSGSGGFRHDLPGSSYTIRHETGTALVYDACQPGGAVLHRSLLAR